MGKESKISEQMERLYLAAKLLKGVEGKSAVAALIDVFPQALNNWESGRPISSEGLLKAQERIGCDSIWLRDGTGDMVHAANSDLLDVAQLITLYGQATPKGREIILKSAVLAEKASVRLRSTGNKPQ